MARCRPSLLSLPSGTAACGRIAPLSAPAGAVDPLQQLSEEGQQRARNPVRSTRFYRKSWLLLVAFCLLQCQQAMLSAEGSKRGAAGGGVAGARSRTASSDRVPRGRSYSYLHYLFNFSVPSSVVITYALLVGAAAAAFFFLRRPLRSSLSSRGAANGVAPRKDDTKRVFRPCASICLNDILLKRKDGDKLCLEESAVQPFLSLCSWSRLYVFVQVKDDEEEHVMNELERIQAFDRGLLRHRVMFCSTMEGRASMVRQLQPLTHVDADSFIGVTLDGKVPNVVCLREPLKECVDVLQAALRRR
eukprot:XP_028353562.1 uncharacterized protein LOC114487492 [Physeter catodon]